MNSVFNSIQTPNTLKCTKNLKSNELTIYKCDITKHQDHIVITSVWTQQITVYAFIRRWCICVVDLLFPQKVIHTSTVSLVVHTMFCENELKERPKMWKYTLNVYLYFCLSSQTWYFQKMKIICVIFRAGVWKLYLYNYG